MTTTTDQVLADAITAELAELADVVEALGDGPAGWDAPTLCDGWRVREVVAHLSMATRWSVPALMLGMLRARFRWHHFSDRAALKDAKIGTSQLVADLRSAKLAAWRPPGGGAQGALVHAVVHGLDITVALELDRRPPPERLRLVLDGLTDPASLKHFGVKLDGIELTATDVDWSYGSGRCLEADAQALVLIVTGRRPA